ncbi:MAG: hypothetical protein Ta2D_13680 [Rickettsiales bacterium]|nr:MAG: hypothetical protein Ta2D_13680 [Rickettsiales bacterium]
MSKYNTPAPIHTPAPIDRPANLNLEKFKIAQEKDSTYNIALNEIKNGKKINHWIWYVFPQIQGLGESSTSKFYAIKDLNEAADYLNDEVLGKRLIEISQALLTHNKSAEDILGDIDACKLKSSMTLFSQVKPENSVFKQVLDKFYNGQQCSGTINRLTPQRQLKQ